MKKLLLLPLFFLSFAQAETLQCKVVAVFDGDSIACLTEDKREIKTKFYQMVAPELDQPYGQEAKQKLSDLILDQYVDLNIHENNNTEEKLVTIISSQAMSCKSSLYFFRIIGKNTKCWRNTNIGFLMLQAGYLHLDPSEKINTSYVKAEKEAREAKRGLWADKSPIAP